MLQLWHNKSVSCVFINILHKKISLQVIYLKKQTSVRNIAFYAWTIEVRDNSTEVRQDDLRPFICLYSG